MASHLKFPLQSVSQIEQAHKLAYNCLTETIFDDAQASSKINTRFKSGQKIQKILLATQNKNYNQNWPCLTKDMYFLSFHSLSLSGQNARRGEFSITFLFLPVPAH
jgi:hypothetical protein